MIVAPKRTACRRDKTNDNLALSLILDKLADSGRNCRKGRTKEPVLPLNIQNPATVAPADELARRRGISKTAAVHQAGKTDVEAA